MASYVDTAVSLAALGYFVFPIAERGKTPLTARGFKDATRDERKILHMWDRSPSANIGIDLGRSGVFAVDMDPKYGVDPVEVIADLGLDAAAMVAVHTGEAPERDDDLPDSLAGVRGMHLYFAGVYPTRATPVHGVEVRGAGGYVVAPGSVHASGVQYMGSLPAVADLPTPPPPILSLLRSSEVSKTVAPRVDGPIIQGQRNGTLTSFAGTMRRRGMAEGAIFAALMVENARCDPPLPEDEVRTIAHSIARYAPAVPPVAAPNGDGPHVEAEAEPEADAGPHPLLMNMTEAMRLAMQPVPWIVDSVAAAGTVTTLAGVRGEAKTWLALFMCANVATGGNLAGIACTKVPALYVDAENGLRTMGRRFLDIGLDPAAFMVADGGRMQLPRDVGILRKLVDATKAKLVILDSLRRLSPGAREDKSDDMAPIYAGLSIIARECDCAIVVLHHRSVKFNAPDTRGSSAIEDQSDLIYVLERDRRDPEGKQRKRLRCTKSRIDAEPDARWLRLKWIGGFATMVETEAFLAPDDEGDGEDPTPPAHAAMVEAINALADTVRKDHAWPPGRIADAVGTEVNNGTFRRALRALVDSSQWVCEGQTRARVYRPKDDDSSQRLETLARIPRTRCFPLKNKGLIRATCLTRIGTPYDVGEPENPPEDEDWHSGQSSHLLGGWREVARIENGSARR
jgi:hypothetical protein